MNIQKEIQLLAPTAKIELFVLDTTMFEGGEILRFHSGLSQVNKPIVWQGETYQPIPIEASGFDATSQGTLPRPTIKVANVGGVMSALAIKMDDLSGARFTRKQTFARYLDAINFPDGLNPEANPDQYFPDQLWYVDQKKLENRHQVEWELASAFDFDGIKLPLRQVVKNTCAWKYRSAECGYTGGYFDLDDKPTADINQDVCPKRLASCKARHNSINVVNLPFGGFPGAERGD